MPRMSLCVNSSVPKLTLPPQRDWGILQKKAALHFFVTPEVLMTELGTSNTFSKFIDLLTDLGSPMPPSSALFLPIMVLKRSEPIIPQTQHFPLCQTPLRLSPSTAGAESLHNSNSAGDSRSHRGNAGPPARSPFPGAGARVPVPIHLS